MSPRFAITERLLLLHLIWCNQVLCPKTVPYSLYRVHHMERVTQNDFGHNNCVSVHVLTVFYNCAICTSTQVFIPEAAAQCSGVFFLLSVALTSALSYSPRSSLAPVHFRIIWRHSARLRSSSQGRASRGCSAPSDSKIFGPMHNTCSVVSLCMLRLLGFPSLLKRKDL